MQMQSAAEASRLPVVNVGSPSELVRLSVSGDMLSAEWLPKDSPVQLRVVLPNPGIVGTAQIPRLRGGPGMPPGFLMLLRDFSQVGSMSVFTTVSAMGGRVQLARDYESAAVSGTTELIQDGPPLEGQPARQDPVRLTIRRTNELTQQDEVRLNLSAPTFVALCRAHPAETQIYLRPIFGDLGADAAVFAPDPKVAWQVLGDDWKADAGLTARVREAIGKFDADDFRQRQSAGQVLHEMGEPAALVLMKMDRSGFSAAVNSGVDTFLAPYLPLAAEEAGKLGRAQNFLLDVQYLNDVELRKLAAARLAKVTGGPVGFDPGAGEEVRLAEVQKAREGMGRATTGP
jgi:hypothetical protein